MRFAAGTLLKLALTVAMLGQPTVGVSDPPKQPEAVSKVEGLELSATLKGAAVKSGDSVPPCRQVIVAAKLTAEKGEVRWLVFGTADVDFETSGNTVALVSLPDGGRIDVFAIASNDGKLSEFASFVIVSRGVPPTPIPVPPGPQPPLPPQPPGPNPTKPIVGKVHVSIIEDAQTRTPETGALIASQTFRAALGQAVFRVFDWRDQSLARSRIVATAQGVTMNRADGSVVAQSALPTLLVSDDAGTVHVAVVLPKGEAAVLATLKPYLGVK